MDGKTKLLIIKIALHIEIVSGESRQSTTTTDDYSVYLGIYVGVEIRFTGPPMMQDIGGRD